MGRLAYVEKSRKSGTRDKSAKRTQRSVAERSKRLDDNKEERKVKKIVIHRELPSEDKTHLLLTQVSQACRIPGTSQDLCQLIRSYAGGSKDETKENSRKRGNEELNVGALERLTDEFLKLQSVAANENEEGDSDNDEDLKTVLVDIMENEYGQRTLFTLLTSLQAVESSKFNDLATVLIEEFEENPALVKHHIACRLMSTLSIHSPEQIQKRVLSIFQQQVTSEDDLIKMLRDNHTSSTIANLLKQNYKDTSMWLRETLSIDRVYKGNNEEDIAARIALLIEDPVASRVIRQLIDSDTRAIFFKHLDIHALMNSKRGSAFLRDLFTFENDNVTIKDSEVVSVVRAILEKIGTELHVLALDRRANFVVQKMISLTARGGSQGADCFQAIVRLLTSTISELLTNRVGVHVVCTLAETALNFSPQVIESTAATIVTRSNVNDLLFSQNGNLVIRALMPIVKKDNGKTCVLLKGAIEQNLDDLTFHEVGNLVVQAYFKEIGNPVASVFAKKIVKDSDYFLSMCRDNFASHVVFALLDCVEPSAHTALCTAIKSHYKVLSTHVNGRFLVEKVIPASSDLRNELLRQFVPLSLEKGTQHILCALASVQDQRGLESLIQKLISNLKHISTQQSGSIVVQKLMQSSPPIKIAVSKALQNGVLRSELLQNYFGKFVVQIADN